ncbi:MAG: SDR family NAD(P)-dependent oxidoreductase [Granulosicoccus sp.]
MSNTANRCILVTGASKGIGAACTQQLLDAGHLVVGLSRHAGIERHGLTQVEIDLTDIEQIAGVVNKLLQHHSIDGLICNAGRGDIGSLENFSSKQIQASLQLNLISPLVLARHCLPTLRQQQRSDIIFIGSESALQGGRFGCLYSAAKFGLRGAAQSLRNECAGANCHVGIVQPGMVRTDFFQTLEFEPGDAAANALQASDVATAAMSMMNAPDNAVIDEIVLNPRQRVVQRKKLQQ